MKFTLEFCEDLSETEYVYMSNTGGRYELEHN